MIENPLSKDDGRVLLKMLAMVFIEIRAAKQDYDETERALAFTNVVSDIFHNVPGGIANGRPIDLIVERARACAKRHGMEPWFDRRLVSARKAVS